MQEKGLVEFFEKFITKTSLFINKRALQAHYTPEVVLHREEQIKQVANVLAPVLKGDKPSNLFIYGKTGTGKSLVTKYTTRQIQEVADIRGLPVKVISINCKLKKVADTEYRLMAQLCKEFGKDVPPTGLPTDEVYRILYSALEKHNKNVILVLDEIDELVARAGDQVLYNLTRINSELKERQISIVGISNDISFTDDLDPRVKSSLSEEELIFPPYDAIQLSEILKQRAKICFRPGAIELGVIEKCAARVASDTGDARRALELLRVAGELAERQDEEKVTLRHLDSADDRIERDRVIELVKTQPKQHQATLYAIMQACSLKSRAVFTGEIYNKYQDICTTTKLRPLTQRRVSDIISEFDMMGLINSKVISKGRYGRTREINFKVSEPSYSKVRQLLEEGLALG